MTTSGITEWALTARDIVQTALEDNAIIAIGEEPEAAELEACIRRLNAMLKSWARGMHLEETGTIAVPANTASGTLAPGIETILSARLVVSATYERQLFKWARDNYLQLPNKAQSGEPTMYYEARGLGGVTIYLWPVPTTTKTLAISYIRVPETVTDASQTIDFPERYQEALYANLALRCTGVFGKEPKPELIARAGRLERDMLDSERPDSYYFEPECA